MRIAVVGVTGMVGGVILQVLKESELVITELIPIASEKSAGKEIVFDGQTFTVLTIEEGLKKNPQIAIFSAGGATSKKWAPVFVKQNCYVIDNSSAWRMDKEIPLVVPEINAAQLTKEHKLIANPNCSTIQMVLALAPLHQAYQLNRLVVSTYQSVTGSGVGAVRQLQDERICRPAPAKFYPHPIDMNLIPHGGDFLENDYTSEEMKLVDETRKILGDDSIRVTATVVRVPVMGGHSESINAEFHQDFEIKDAVELMRNYPGITIQDTPLNNDYPMPKFAEGKNDVFVGRIRKDESQDKTMNMWVVADNLRKGAATNAVQIAEYITKNFAI
ncbi:aspartate-semialdehyde dehydrogenase [Lentimicrobium sp. S6]|uniref:aspartate-semialdehyde dehydrogenase n=1 Tax=Lentimicrobium sp. S6 TaxID=2735872 RepID=UPI001556DE45|nr:aspartate-semialdehyde dehydrogenase [Lentimicrobium sp. S6]NPD47387.1 aspartate-semialdehyde dehydrogenase [Lentimicrobium sp. S6]